MKRHVVHVLAGLSVSLAARAELPALDEKPWLGVFAGFENRDYRFQFASDGSAVIHPLFKDRQIYPYVRIPIEISLVETLANGSTKIHAIVPESLESPDRATRKLDRTTVRGSFEGGASFELSLEEKRGEILLGGKLVDPGDLDAEKTRLRITAELLNFYGKKKEELADDPKAFDALARESSLSFTTKDRKRSKLDFTKSLPAGSGGGVASVVEAEVELAVVGHKRFSFRADGPSTLQLDPRRKGPIHSGLFIAWSPEAATKPAGDALFAIRVR